MRQPLKTIDSFTTSENGILELRQRGERGFMIFFNGLVLMNSSAQRSEIALGRLGCRALQNHPAPRVLVGGLGMGITLRAVLDSLPATAQIVVSELNHVIVDWCRGPLAILTDGALGDPRVSVQVGDCADLIRECARGNDQSGFDGIILDLYEGPHDKTDKRDDPIYGSRAIEYTRNALNPGGTFAVWGEMYDEGFYRRLSRGGFNVKCQRPGKGGYRHAVFLATRK